MEDGGKVGESAKQTIEEVTKEGASEKHEEKPSDAEVIDELKAKAVEEEVVPQSETETKSEKDTAAADVSKVVEEKPKDTEIQSKIEEVRSVAIEEVEEDEPPQTIEECDAGGDEIPDVSEALELTRVEAKTEAAIADTSADKEGNLLTELTTVTAVEVSPVKSEANKSQSEVVAIDDDEDEGDDDDDDEDEDDDEDDDDDEVDDGISNEAMNDDDEEEEEDDDDDQDLYDDDENEKEGKIASSSRDAHAPHPLDDFDDNYADDEDDNDIADMKEDSNAAVVIGSSDDEAEELPVPVKKPSPQKFEELDSDDDDDYDDDDMMNAVVTSASKAMSSSSSSSPVKNRNRPQTSNAARQREADQISALKRRINYRRIAKKKSLNWILRKKTREAYKLFLPQSRTGFSSSVAMRSDQSGGLLHLKISPPSVTPVTQKPLIRSSVSTPIISQTPAATIPQKSEEQPLLVIDLDSSPEKDQEKTTSSPHSKSDDQRNSETGIKKPPDNKEQVEDEEKGNTMQQTDKVRDSIQKSTEQVEEDKSVARLSSEQNKENLQSNEAALKKEKDEVSSKHEAEPKDIVSSEETMDTTENVNESGSKLTQFTISSVTSLGIKDIKEEKMDEEPTPPPPTVEEVAASKVSIEDVQEKEIVRDTASPQPSSVGAAKRRRSSSVSKTPKPTSSTTTATEQDDDEEYIHPTKKLREELQSNYPAHDRILNEYIEKTSNDSIDTISRHIEQMLSEIQTLNDMIKAKEIEWNNMLHLKKVKEEICIRLTRRKQCMEIMATKVGETGHSAGLDEEFMTNESMVAPSKTPPPHQNPQLSSTPISAAINSLASNICNFTAVSSSSSAAPTTAQLIIQNRANMKSSDLAKEKANTQRLHRNILPKPTAAGNIQQSPSTNGPTAASSSTNQPILNSYLTSPESVQQLVDMMNGHHNNHSGLLNGGAAGGNNSQAAMVGRQGPFKDVRSIIADFRQQHPEVVPRRGRRVKNSNNSNLSDSNTILGNALKSDTNSRPSSNDSSSHSLTNPTNQTSANHNNVNSFKDVLAPFAKSQAAASLRSAGGQQQNPPYPEVTLHPVSTPLNASGGQDQPTGSLLHGILTKFSRPNESANTKSVANQTSNYISNFSPTLARLLTAPERISAGGVGSGGNQSHHSSVGGSGDGGGGTGGSAHHSMPSFGVNLSKVVGHNSEITITPVMNSMHQQSMLQQQLQQQQLKEVFSRAAAVVGGNSGTSVKDEHFLKLSSFAAASAGNDDDAEDSVDRLVIDEGVDSMVGVEEQQRIAPHAIGQEFNENEVPVCQGCKKHEAQFVCAGCGNQWYCSRECQVTAWDDHSEVCTG